MSDYLADFDATQTILSHVVRAGLVVTILLSLVAWLLTKAEKQRAESREQKADGARHPIRELDDLGLERCDLSEYFKTRAAAHEFDNRRGML